VRTILHWLDIAIFVAIVVADALGFVPLTQTIFLIPFIWITLRLRHEPWSGIGFEIPAGVVKLVVLGVIAGILMELIAVYVTTPAISGYFGIEPDYSDFSGLQGNLQLLFIFIGLSWVFAAIGEEVCFRGFLMKRIALVCGGGQWAWIVSLVASSILFGWGHTEQGVSGWVQEGLSGFLLGILFLAARRNLIVPIIAHGVSNTLAFVLIYFGNYPGIGVQAA
jgi:membrane protease YdiL (CAAX protease family)